jgi:hypothetical protein
MRLFVWGSNMIQDVRDTRAPGFWLLVGPFLFFPSSGDGGEYSKTL